MQHQEMYPEKLTRNKKSFNFTVAFQKIREAIQDFPRAAMFQLAAEGYNSPFGKHICTLNRPHCSTCPVVGMCLQVGVKNPT